MASYKRADHFTIAAKKQGYPARSVFKLEEIAAKEKLKYEKNALFMIAKATEGALRDAESLLDQLASFSEGKIKEEDVLTLLGLHGFWRNFWAMARRMISTRKVWGVWTAQSRERSIVRSTSLPSCDSLMVSVTACAATDSSKWRSA